MTQIGLLRQLLQRKTQTFEVRIKSKLTTCGSDKMYQMLIKGVRITAVHVNNFIKYM